MSETNDSLQEEIKEAAGAYLSGEKPFLSLDLKDTRGREIALYCLTRNTLFLKQLDKTTPVHLSLLANWIDRDYSNFIHIYNNKLSTTALLERYLYRKFKATIPNNSDISIMYSLNGKILVSYRYSTKRGETVSYFDTSLGVPTPLTVTANLRTKIVDADSFIKSLDYHISILDLPLAYEKINTTVGKTIRNVLLDFIIEKDLSYYQLPQYYSEINSKIITELNQNCAEMGLEIADFNILDIAIPNNTQEMFERQYFAISEAKKVKEYEYALEESALILYEKKAEIHNKYPDFPVSLTEAEKDFALNRYLNRNGIDTALSAEIRSKALANPDEQPEGTLTTAKTTKTQPSAESHFKTIYFTLFLLALFASCLSCIGSVAAGLIAIGFTVLLFGIIAIVAYPRFLDKKKETDRQGYIKQLNINQNDNDNADAADDDKMGSN